MAEYIDREELRKILETWRDAHADVDDEDGFSLLEDVLRELNAQATADVAPVVYCRECKYHHWEQEPCHGRTEHYCSLIHGLTTVLRDTFCSYGTKYTGDTGNG